MKGYLHTSKEVISMQNPKRQRVCPMTSGNTAAGLQGQIMFRDSWSLSKSHNESVQFIEYSTYVAYSNAFVCWDFRHCFVSTVSQTVILTLLYIPVYFEVIK